MRRAFTLIELAAVSSVLASGMAVFVPAVRFIHQQDRLAGSLANLRAIAGGSLMYAANDPDELVIPVPNLSVLPPGVGTFEWGGKAGRGQLLQPGSATSSYFGTANFRGPAHRPLNFLLYKSGFTDWNPADGEAQPGPGGINYLRDAQLDLDVYRCPADTGYAGGGFYYRVGRNFDISEAPFVTSGLTGYDHYGNSYVANTFKIVVGSSGARISSNSPFLMPLSRIPAPGRTVAYQELPSRSMWLWGSWSDSSCSWTSRQDYCVGNFAVVPGWHQRDFNFNTTFVDGHAASVEMQGCLRPPPNLGQYPPNPCGGSINPYHCFRCVTIRGPNWQLDTLPEEPVPTPW